MNKNSTKLDKTAWNLNKNGIELIPTKKFSNMQKIWDTMGNYSKGGDLPAPTCLDFGSHHTKIIIYIGKMLIAFDSTCNLVELKYNFNYFLNKKHDFIEIS